MVGYVLAAMELFPTAAASPFRSRPASRKARRPSDGRVERIALAIAITVAFGSISLLSDVAAAAPASSVAPAVLEFRDGAGHDRSLTLATLRERCRETTVEVEDPYHERMMRYVALPLVCVLDLGFEASGGAEGQRGKGMLLRALDGYTRPVSGRQLLEPGAFLAFGEAGLETSSESSPKFSLIDRRQVDPSPFYLVWTGVSQNDPHDHPWPYQLSRIEIAPFEQAFPRTVPSELAPEDAGWKGYAIFQRSCASCHAINGEGGRVGPELNVPRSIVEYRPIPQIRSYIRDPEATRYTSMPPHPDLSDADLDALIAYFRAMSQRKDDPAKRTGS